MTPDGRYLFVAQAGTGTGLARWQVARLDMQSGDADVITQAEGGGMRPLVSRDGKLVVYATRYETKTGLRVRNLETGATKSGVITIDGWQADQPLLADSSSASASASASATDSASAAAAASTGDASAPY